MKDTFEANLLSLDGETPENLIDGHDCPAGRRYNVYRNNIMSSLIEALEANFPTVRTLIGAENFTNLARDFVRAHPPKSQILAHYGDDFAPFIEAHPNLRQFPYLSEMAKIDHLIRESYHAKDHEPLAIEKLASIPPEEIGSYAIDLAPSLRFHASPYPIFDIWQFAQGNGPAPKTSGPQSILILREGFDPKVYALDPNHIPVLRALQKGESLVIASSHIDITPLLSQLISSAAICEIYQGEDL